MEIWKDIPEYEGYYQINESGVVRNIQTGYIKKQEIGSAGYYRVSLWKKGKGKPFNIHRLLGLMFIPNPENKAQINHIDGDKLNNKLSNLEWATAKENSIHAWETGLSLAQYGEECAYSILTNKDIEDIVIMLNNGMSCGKVAKIKGVSFSMISMIRRNVRWPHLEKDLKPENFTKKCIDKPIKDQYGAVYKSISEAGRLLGLSIGNISSVLHGNRNHTGGYVFSFIEEV